MLQEMDIDHDGGPVVQCSREISGSAGVLDRRCLQTAETSYSCGGYKNVLKKHSVSPSVAPRLQ